MFRKGLFQNFRQPRFTGDMLEQMECPEVTATTGWFAGLGLGDFPCLRVNPAEDDTLLPGLFEFRIPPGRDLIKVGIVADFCFTL